jgi:hypothetical protein
MQNGIKKKTKDYWPTDLKWICKPSSQLPLALKSTVNQPSTKEWPWWTKKRAACAIWRQWNSGKKPECGGQRNKDGGSKVMYVDWSRAAGDNKGKNNERETMKYLENPAREASYDLSGVSVTFRSGWLHINTWSRAKETRLISDTYILVHHPPVVWKLTM